VESRRKRGGEHERMMGVFYVVLAGHLVYHVVVVGA
jgi:hypothetical protein